MERDYKGYGKLLQQTLDKIEKSNEICEENKRDIVRYYEYLKAQSFKVSTQCTNVYDLFLWTKLLNAPFINASKTDVIKAVADLEGKYKSRNFKLNMKIVFRKFFKWLKDSEEYPEEVKWIKVTAFTNYKDPSDVLTREEIEKMANASENLRDKALLLMLFESGCRIGEILNILIKDVHFDTLGCTISVNGKTGERSVRLLDKNSIKALVDWLNAHPMKEDRNSFVWVTIARRVCKPVSYSTIEDMLVRIRKKAGIEKDANFHSFRHGRATMLSKVVPQAVMTKHFGWTPDSKMARTYYHLSNKDVDEALLKAHGLKTPVEEIKPMGDRTCVNCGETNSILSQFCRNCQSFLDVSIAWKEQDEAVARVLDELRKEKWFGKKVRAIIKGLGIENKFK